MWVRAPVSAGEPDETNHSAPLPARVTSRPGVNHLPGTGSELESAGKSSSLPRPGTTRNTATFAGRPNWTVTRRGTRVSLLRRDLRREVVVLPEHVRAVGHARAKDAEQQGRTVFYLSARNPHDRLREDPQ